MSALRELAEWLVSMDDPENAEGLEVRRSVTLTQIIERAGAALEATPVDTRFTDALDDHERALLMLSVTFLLLDGTLGVLGKRWPEEQMDRDLPLILALANDLGGKWGQGIDPMLMEKVEATIEAKKRTREQATTS